MIETKVQIAADLLPLIKHLWQGGVLSINGHSDSVHLEDKLFHETFPEVVTPTEQRENGDWAFETIVDIDGKPVRFYCLHGKECWE